MLAVLTLGTKDMLKIAFPRSRIRTRSELMHGRPIDHRKGSRHVLLMRAARLFVHDDCPRVAGLRMNLDLGDLGSQPLFHGCLLLVDEGFDALITEGDSVERGFIPLCRSAARSLNAVAKSANASNAVVEFVGHIPATTLAGWGYNRTPRFGFFFLESQ
jgi:hypothetical protein